MHLLLEHSLFNAACSLYSMLTMALLATHFKSFPQQINVYTLYLNLFISTATEPVFNEIIYLSFAFVAFSFYIL